MTYVAAASVDRFGSTGYTRRLVSQSKKFSSDSAWEVINDAMQVLGGIGYTNVYPVERLLRDLRLMMIWTGTNEIMNLIIQHEYYRELQKKDPELRESELDAKEAFAEEEKIYE